jgi:Tol biopolymer transport system component/DNA-binding winged helix-turn-helix (wHTH) protein
MTERKCLVFSFADVQVREREFSIVRNGEVLPVEPKAFRVLLFLLRNPQKLITKEELLDAVWGDTAVSENSLTRSIALLRRLLADDTHEPRYIATVPTVGYRFLCNVRVAEEGSAELNAQGSNPTVKPSADDKPAPAADGERKGAAMSGIFAGVGVAVLLLAAFLTWAIGGGRVFGHAAHPGGKTASNARVVPLTTVAGNVWGQAFSPDGKQIAFMWDGENPVKGDLYVQLVGGQRPLRLTHTQSGYICCADWSPDGQEIAFGRCTDDGGGVYVVPALGGVERKLTDVACPFGTAGQAKWTADGKSLALVDSCAPPNPPGIMLFSITTGEKHCVTAPPPYADPGDEGIALSPDGETIAFCRAVTLGYEEIYAVELSGKNLRRLTPVDKPTGISSFMWTPDGRYIVFGSDRTGAVRPWRVRPEGGAIEPETVYPNVGALTSDGQRLAYVEISGLPPETWKAELAAPGGKVLSMTKLVVSSGGNDATQLSPDGREIVFRSQRMGRNDLWKSNADGSDPQKLTSFDKGWPGTPRWSPDGKWIVFDSRLGEHSHITMVDSEGRNQHDVVAGDYENVVPSWSRDGRFIYFVSNRTGKWQVWKRELATGEETQVTRNGGFGAFESYDAKTLYYSRFEGGGLWSMPTGGGSEEHITNALHRGYWGYFAVTEAGIYLLDVDAAPRPTIMYYSFQTRQLRPVLQLEEHPLPWGANLSASRDGRILLITQGMLQSTLTMEENF